MNKYWGDWSGIMGLENLKIWHWMILGAVFGALLGWSKTNMPQVSARSITSSDFERLARQKSLHDLPTLKNLTIHPDGSGGYMVSGMQLYDLNNNGRTMGYDAFELDVPTPFVPTRGPKAGKPTTLVGYLADTEEHPVLEFKNQWWMGPRETVLLYGGGGMFLVGLVWPLAIQLMVAGGLAKRRPRETFDLGKFGNGPTTTAQAKPVVTNAQSKQLDRLLGHMEGAGKSGGFVEAVNTESKVAESAPVKLGGGPVVAAGAGQSEEEKHFGGAFYPTVVHGEESHPKDESGGNAVPNKGEN
jgi:hypothetical protein